MLSLELVPWTSSGLNEQLDLARDCYSKFDVINVPDQDKYALRSWEACKLARDHGFRSVPHIRARRLFVDGAVDILDSIHSSGIEDILVVRGDANPAALKSDSMTSLDAIRFFREYGQGLRIFAALDQYRQSMNEELKYAAEKLRSGASGFFSQPFFDVCEMERWGSEFDAGSVWFGISPVLSEKSMKYWEVRNKVVFPAGFEPTLEWNRSYLKDALEFVKSSGANAYIMPIRCDLVSYFDGIIGSR